MHQKEVGCEGEAVPEAAAGDRGGTGRGRRSGLGLGEEDWPWGQFGSVPDDRLLVGAHDR